jgi:hypothetical protein
LEPGAARWLRGDLHSDSATGKPKECGMVRDLYAKARAALNGTLNQSEKLGLRALLAQSQSLLDYALQLSGNAKEAAGHFAAARRDLDEIKKETGNHRVAKRSGLAPIYSAATN